MRQDCADRVRFSSTRSLSMSSNACLATCGLATAEQRGLRGLLLHGEQRCKGPRRGRAAHPQGGQPAHSGASGAHAGLLCCPAIRPSNGVSSARPVGISRPCVITRIRQNERRIVSEQQSCGSTGAAHKAGASQINWSIMAHSEVA